MSRLWQWATSPTITQLEADLRSISCAELLAVVPAETANRVAEASRSDCDRRYIMTHLWRCWADLDTSNWRRIHGGLVLLDQLLRRGSPTLLAEIAQGQHFDPLQRLTLLERFRHEADRRVEGVVRSKATELRTRLLAKVHGGGDVAAAWSPTAAAAKGEDGAGGEAEAAGGGFGSSQASTGRMVGFGGQSQGTPDESLPIVPGPPPPDASRGRSRGRGLVNDIAAIRFHADTSSSDDEKEMPLARKADTSTSTPGRKDAGNASCEPHRGPAEEATGRIVGFGQSTLDERLQTSAAPAKVERPGRSRCVNDIAGVGFHADTSSSDDEHVGKLGAAPAAPAPPPAPPQLAGSRAIIDGIAAIGFFDSSGSEEAVAEEGPFDPSGRFGAGRRHLAEEDIAERGAGLVSQEASLL